VSTIAPSTAERWDALHRQARHRLEYPSEHVVRFLAGLELDMPARALDIGCGSGRHAILLDAFGFDTYACDVSADAVRGTRVRWTAPANRVTQAQMTALPYADDHFDIAVSYAVFYYGTAQEAQRAIDELHRVLKPGGRALVCVPTSDDWRASLLDDSGRFQCEDSPEDGMAMSFQAEWTIITSYGAFSHVRYELSETTFSDRTRTNSDWLISVTK